MQWIAPTAKDAATATLEKRLWDAADALIDDLEKASLQSARPADVT